MLSEAQIREKLSPLRRDANLNLIILFGSAVTGSTHAHSDIDLAFSFQSAVDIVSLTNTVTQLLGTDNVDVVDVRRASPLLSFSIVRTGRLLYEDAPGQYNQFCSLAFRMYADTKKLRDAGSAGIKKYLEASGLS